MDSRVELSEVEPSRETKDLLKANLEVNATLYKSKRLEADSNIAWTKQLSQEALNLLSQEAQSLLEGGGIEKFIKI